jgi:hypothetical protein
MLFDGYISTVEREEKSLLVIKLKLTILLLLERLRKSINNLRTTSGPAKI